MLGQAGIEKENRNDSAYSTLVSSTPLSSVCRDLAMNSRLIARTFEFSEEVRGVASFGGIEVAQYGRVFKKQVEERRCRVHRLFFGGQELVIRHLARRTHDLKDFGFGNVGVCSVAFDFRGYAGVANNEGGTVETADRVGGGGNDFGAFGVDGVPPTAHLIAGEGEG